ncbi:MAG: YqiA/YcfP family alpha/beta fold hydrolase [Nitrospirota bacterium]
MEERRLEFSVKGRKLVGILHLPPRRGEERFPCVICSHGYISNKESRKYLQIGRQFSLEGIAVLRFDHRGALGGESDGNPEDTTLTGRVEDNYAALDSLKATREIDSNRLGLLGSSLGGMDILLVKNQAVKAKVVIATPFSFPDSSEEMLNSFLRKGYYQFLDGSRIKNDFYEDLKQYDLKKEVSQMNCPILIIHGDLDEQIPLHHAKVLFEVVREPKELRIIEGGDHTFSDINKLNEVLTLSLDWFRKYF